jgi:tetratricopeptide (TPR) repeat protein
VIKSLYGTGRIGNKKHRERLRPPRGPVPSRPSDETCVIEISRPCVAPPPRLHRPGLLPGLCLLVGLMTGCASGGSAASVAIDAPHYTLAGGNIPKPPVPTKSMFGAYLAGNFAVRHHDDLGALSYYGLVLRSGGGNGSSTVAGRSLQIAVDAGRMDLALPLARQIAKAEPDNALVNLVLSVSSFKQGHIDDSLAHTARLPGDGLFLLFSSLLNAWGAAAQNPDMPAGLDKAFAPLSRDPQFSGLALIHRALIEDLANQQGAAERDYRAALAMGTPPLRLIELAGNFLERAGKRDDAAALYHTFTDAGGVEMGIAPALSSGKPARIVATPAQGLAEAMFDIASIAGSANIPEVALLGTRLALVLRPDYPQAQFSIAEIYASRDQIDEARAAYHAIPRTAALSWASRIADAQLLIKLHRNAEALVVVKAMIAARPDDAEPQIILGDLLRATGDQDGAAAAYSKALAIVGPNAPKPQLWQLYFSRGAAREQANHWAEGEADLRQAMTYFRDPVLLNYLGFAMVVRDEKLEEARALIEKAVALAPNTAAYVDSLGWADYHLKQYRKAKASLEQATQLAPGNA